MRFAGKLVLFAAVVGGLQMADAQLFRVLVINQSGDWPHDDAINELSKRYTSLATAMNFQVKQLNSTSNPNIISHMVMDTLKRYHVVVWNNNTSIGKVITSGSPRNNFQQWLKEGGGLVAIHGVMDHADSWPWIRDSVLGGTRFTQHSPWNSALGTGAKVRWDDKTTNGSVMAEKPEYKFLKAGTPTGWFTYPDEWYSFTINPRSKVDVLLRIDEATFDVAEKMGDDHPVAWSYKLPAVAGQKKQGRFIYHARGHMAPAFSGTGSGAAPNDAWGNDKSPTYNFIKYSICWAAAGREPLTGTGTLLEDCTVETVSSVKAALSGKMEKVFVSKKEKGLLVKVQGNGTFKVNVYGVAGNLVGSQNGEGGDFVFPNLAAKSQVFFVKVFGSNQKPYAKRIVL